MTPMQMFLLYNVILTSFFGTIWRSTGVDAFLKICLWVDCFASVVFLLISMGMVLAPGVRII